MGNSVFVLKPGLYSSIQDKGRWGYAHLGIPESGAIDKKAFHKVNQILNNKIDTAVVEYTMLGPTIRFETNTFFALSGGEVTAFLDKDAIRMEQVYEAKTGQVLEIGSIHKGCRGYLGISGGFLTEQVFGSRSMYTAITTSKQIKKGEKIPIGNATYISGKGARLKRNLQPRLWGSNKEYSITAFRGPEYDKLPETLQKLLEEKSFTISKNWNRMAIQLEELISNTLETILTGPVIPGTVQLTSGGKLIILMADCQVTGGYPRIVQLTEEGLHTIAIDF